MNARTDSFRHGSARGYESNTLATVDRRMVTPMVRLQLFGFWSVG